MNPNNVINSKEYYCLYPSTYTNEQKGLVVTSTLDYKVVNNIPYKLCRGYYNSILTYKKNGVIYNNDIITISLKFKIWLQVGNPI